jgi:hypothetical protein
MAFVQAVFSERTASWLFLSSLGLGRSQREEEDDEQPRRSISVSRTFSVVSRPADVENKLKNIAHSLAKDIAACSPEIRGFVLIL